jgi:hypothetical protein
MPLHRHDRRLRPLPPGPSPRLRRRTATSLARSVLVVPPDFDGFLRRAAIRRPLLSTVCRFVAPCSRSWGSPGFHAPVRLLAAGGRGRSACRSTFPLAKTLRSFSLSGSPPTRHRVTPSEEGPLLRRSSRESSAFTEQLFPLAVGFTSSGPCCHGFVRRFLDLRAFTTEESVAVAGAFPPLLGPMLPWALDRFVRMPAARMAPTRFLSGRSTWSGSTPSQVSVATREWRGRQGLGLSGSVRCWDRPEGRRPAGPVRWQPEDRCASVPPDHPEGRPGSVAGFADPKADEHRVGTCPEEPIQTPGEIPREPPAAGPFHPKVLGFQQIAPSTRATTRRQWSPPPEGGGPNRRPLTETPCWASSSNLPLRLPKEPHREANRNHPKVMCDSWLRSRAPASWSHDRPRARQTSSPPKRPGPKSPRRPEGHRAGANAGGAVGAAQAVP